MAAPAPATPQHEAPSYRLQREQGFRWLNFSPELEVAYRRATKPMTDHQSNVALFCGLVIWLAFIGMDVIRLQDRATDLFSNPRLLTLVQVRITVLMALAGCWLALLQTDPRFKRPWVVAGMLYLLTLGGTISNDTHAALGTPHENNVLILLMVVIFLPLGLRLKEASAVAVLCLVSLANHPEGQRESIFYRLFYLLVAACIGGMGAYLREYAQREQFLLRAELEWLARRDALTGLHNRRAFNEHLELALSVGRRDNQPVALMMIDADHFKLYNDAYGHAAGDHALQRLAEVLQGLCRRPLDHAARTGGEEMALVLYGVNAAQAQGLSEQLVQRVRALALAHKASPTAEHLTVSVGCAISLPLEEAKSLYTRADALLYQAKRQGRNKASADIDALSSSALRPTERPV